MTPANARTSTSHGDVTLLHYSLTSVPIDLLNRSAPCARRRCVQWLEAQEKKKVRRQASNWPVQHRATQHLQTDEVSPHTRKDAQGFNRRVPARTRSRITPSRATGENAPRGAARVRHLCCRSGCALCHPSAEFPLSSPNTQLL